VLRGHDAPYRLHISTNRRLISGMTQSEREDNVVDAKELFRARARNAWYSPVSVAGLARVVALPHPQSMQTVDRSEKILSDAEEDRLKIRIAAGPMITALENAGFEQEALALEQQCMVLLHDDGNASMQSLRDAATSYVRSVSVELLERLINNRGLLGD
jgi:hypothetical protein